MDPSAPYLSLSSLVSAHGKVLTVRMGSVPCVVLADYDVIRRCFQKRAFSGRAPLALVCERGIPGVMFSG